MKPTELNKDYILKTGKHLNKAIDKGFGVEYSSVADAEKSMSMRRNAWLFSSAKNVVLQHDLASKMTDANGQMKTWEAFRKEAIALNPKYNQTYLQAEYQTVLASSQAARKWQDIQRRKERYPNLQYKTVDDGNVRDEHQKLHGIIRPVDSAFWGLYYPPNGWRCRCYVVQTDRPSNGDYVPEVDEKTVPTLFRDNLAIKGDVLPAGHVYFEKMKGLNAEDVQKRPDIMKAIPYQEVESFSNGGKVAVHPFAPQSELKQLLEQATIAAKNMGWVVAINGESKVKNEKNPDFTIDKKAVELKSPTSYSSIHKRIGEARKQKANAVIINADGINDDILIDWLYRNYNFKFNSRFSYMLINRNHKSTLLTREDSINKNFDGIRKIYK